MKELKIFEEYFQPVLEDIKQFEIHYNDRNFQAGEEYCLREVKQKRINKTVYTGRECLIKIKDVFPLDSIGFSNYVAFTFEKLNKPPQKLYSVIVEKHDTFQLMTQFIYKYKEDAERMKECAKKVFTKEIVQIQTYELK